MERTYFVKLSQGDCFGAGKVHRSEVYSGSSQRRLVGWSRRLIGLARLLVNCRDVSLVLQSGLIYRKAFSLIRVIREKNSCNKNQLA